MNPARWEPPHWDVPSRGQPMSARVETAAAPYRRLVQGLARTPSDVLLGAAKPLGVDSLERAVRLIAGTVAVRTAVEGYPANVAGALRWFCGERALSATTNRHMQRLDWSHPPDEQFAALLPYALDPFGPTARRALIAGRVCRDERVSRKRLGAFYTPGDVARTLAEEVITPETRRVLDPACGAGVFLRAAFTRLARTLTPEQAVGCLHGVDIDAAAIDACGLVLTHDWLMRDPLTSGETPIDRFRQVCSQLTHADALSLFAQPRSSLEPPDDMQVLRSPRPRFDAILANPPFAPVGPRESDVNNGFKSLRAAKNPAGVNMMWPFWELASRAVTKDGRIGIVLPLSCAYLSGDAARLTRRAVFERGRWEMRFYDRAPDALFGDDVKQRVALVFRRPGTPGVIRTNAMRRWSADRRAEALEAREEDGIDLPARPDLVVKIGSAGERDAIDHLLSLPGTLSDAAIDVRLTAAMALNQSGQAIAVAPTAYNWIGAYRDNAVASKARCTVAGKLLELLFADRTMADAAYAILASHVFLWWWRATGDLFHVSRSSLISAPFPLHACTGKQLNGLATAGRACWRAAVATPITSVNRGVVTVAFRPSAEHRALAAVDREVGGAFGLSPQFVRFVRDDAVRLRGAGREV